MQLKRSWRVKIVIFLQSFYQFKRLLAQKLIDLILKVLGVALVANYVAEKKMVQLEIIPSFTLKARSREMDLFNKILEQKGDEIEAAKEVTI